MIFLQLLWDNAALCYVHSVVNVWVMMLWTFFFPSPVVFLLDICFVPFVFISDTWGTKLVFIKGWVVELALAKLNLPFYSAKEASFAVERDKRSNQKDFPQDISWRSQLPLIFNSLPSGLPLRVGNPQCLWDHTLKKQKLKTKFCLNYPWFIKSLNMSSIHRWDKL